MYRDDHDAFARRIALDDEEEQLLAAFHRAEEERRLRTIARGLLVGALLVVAVAELPHLQPPRARHEPPSPLHVRLEGPDARARRACTALRLRIYEGRRPQPMLNASDLGPGLDPDTLGRECE